MNATMQDTLLDLFQQVIEGPERMPALPTDVWQKSSEEERHLLVSFGNMVERMQQSRQEAEKQLREKEAQYRAIFEASSDGLFVSDLEDGHIVEINPAACRQLGYSYEELIGLHPTTFIHPDSHHVFAESLQTIKAGGQFQGRGVNLRKDGTPFYVEVHSTAFTYKGKSHILGVVRDITEREQAEEQLREKEAQYRAIFEATSDGLSITDLNGIIVEANPAICKMFCYSYEEFIGLPPTALTHPDSLHLVTEALQTVRVGAQLQTQSVAICKDGTSFHVETRATPFMYKGQPHLLSVVRDMTERVRAEEQLREREAQYRSVFEATSDGLLISDLNGYIIEVNPAACEMYGYPYEELIGLHGAALVPPDVQQRVAERLQTIQMGDQFRAQSVGVRKNGTPFHMEIRGTPFTYKGQPYILGVTRDITEQVLAQQLLEQRVEERTRELSTLLEVSHNVASTLELKPLLGLILDQLKVVADYTGASILTVEGQELMIVANRGPNPAEQVRHLRFPLERMGLLWEVLCRREPVMIDNVRDDTSLAQAYRQLVGEFLETVFSYTRALMGIPLTLKEQVIGILVLTSREPGYFTPRHGALALAIANQAAVAIENARLYERAQELAALEERQKLARELHDSVSQALYGISLGAHAARTALDRDPSQLTEPLDYVLTLAEAALAEMRALIFELRPESLEKEGLVSALTRQATAIHGRNNIAISTELCDEPDLLLRVKQDLYRIAQEALHNTVKHARASRVDLRLEQTSEGVVLEVRDDGVGFNTTASFPGHLGLLSMRERVANLGGTFEIESAPGAGTRIWVRVPGGV